MAGIGNEEGDEAPPRGNEWEFVNLTASAYAASPVDLNHGNSVGENEIEASDPMFVSGHFVFPPSRHKNLPPEPQNSEMNDVECGEFDVPQLNAGEERGKSDDNDASFVELMSDKFPGDPVLDEISNTLLASSADFQEDLIVDKEEESAESHEDSRFLSCEEEKFDCEEVPCEAWWKRRAVSLFSQAKEANSFWSVFITAAVMGIVIIGHHWNKKRWHVLQIK